MKETNYKRLWRSTDKENVRLHNENQSLKELVLKMQAEIKHLRPLSKGKTNG